MPKTYCPWPITEVLTNICERDLCAWVVEPGNTGSNIAYFLVGLWILRCSHKGNLAHEINLERLRSMLEIPPTKGSAIRKVVLNGPPLLLNDLKSRSLAL